jgi:protein-S-isoprenylcysteine O-methyltransferase Ste14
MAWGQLQLPDSLRWAGEVGTIAGLGLTTWMFRSLGNNITDTVDTRRDHALVTSGPYRWIRHPLYTFAAFTYFNLSLLMASWITGLMIIVAFGLLAMRTPKEEAKLVERFGDAYLEYMRKTGRFLPRLVGRQDKLTVGR